MSMGRDWRVQSEPVEIHWLGFRSDTLTLQRQGWAISANQDVTRDTMAIAMKHERSGIYMVSHVEQDWRYREMCDIGRSPRQRGIQIDGTGKVIHVHPSMSLLDFGRFSPIDAVPAVIETQIRSLEDLVYFRKVEEKGLLLPQQEVDSLMARILDLQEPMRADYFRDQARAGNTQLHAQIFSMRAA